MVTGHAERAPDLYRGKTFRTSGRPEVSAPSLVIRNRGTEYLHGAAQILLCRITESAQFLEAVIGNLAAPKLLLGVLELPFGLFEIGLGPQNRI